jgi:hypothetical protein
LREVVRIADLDFHLVGDVRRHLVSTDACQTAQITGSANRLTSSRLSERSYIVAEVGKSQIVMNLTVTNVPECIGSNANNLGLQHLQFLDIGASSVPPNGTRIVHHGKKLVASTAENHSRWRDSPVQERS